MIVALALATPLAARDLAVPADKGWQHAATGLILTARLHGMPRTALHDTTQSEHDVTAQFETPGQDVIATLYLFKPAIAGTALWFDRARTALEANRAFGRVTPATAAPIGFVAGGVAGGAVGGAVGGAQVAASLRQIYAVTDSPFRSTALAVMPLGEWIVAVRMSARSLEADQLDTQLLQLIADIRWPTTRDTGTAANAGSGTAATTAVAPIAACARPLTFRKARQVKTDGAAALMELVGNMAAQQQVAEGKKKPEPPRQWCREGDASVAYGVYRVDGDERHYVMALGDAGRVISVHPSIMGQVHNSGTYAVTLTDVDGWVQSFPSFSARPAPAQVWAMLNGGAPSMSAKGNAVMIDPKSF